MNRERIKKLQRTIKPPILIKKQENLFYLTGQWFMHGYLLVAKKGVVFFGDGLEKVEGIKKTDRLKYIGKYLGRSRVLQLEDEFTFAEYDYIKRKVQSEKRKTKIQHTKSPVDYQRQIKDLSELRLMGKSMNIVAKVFEQVRKQLRLRLWTEIGLANFIKTAGLKLGAEDVSFPPIVASGVNAAIPHHIPSSKRLKAGESIITDFGFKYKGYCSDFTRTVFLKRAPLKLEQAYNHVEKAYHASMALVLVGTKTRDVYKRAVDVLAEKKLDKYFIHNLGHGAGLEIHELPNLSPKSKDVLENGMVFSIEPGVYIPRLGGIRIEDLVYLHKGQTKKFIHIQTELRSNIL